MNKTENKKYLEPTFFINSDSAEIHDFVYKNISTKDDDITKAVKLYYAVRDGFFYNPYYLDFKKEAMQASYLINKKTAYCIEKAIILAATYRNAGLPARIGFANVRNHIGTEKLETFLGSNLLVFHGYAEVFLDGKWVKSTPAFNKELCEMLNVEPLEFDGKNDSVFQEYNKLGGKFMVYEHYYGEFDDLPYDLMVSELKKHYPHLFESEHFDKEKLVVSFK